MGARRAMFQMGAETCRTLLPLTIANHATAVIQRDLPCFP